MTLLDNNSTDLTVKRNDTWPPIRAALADVEGSVDLTGATQVKILLKGDTVSINGICTIEDAAGGEISYTWDNDDLAVAGTYRLEFEVTWPTGHVETIPNDDYLVVVILEDLG